MKFDVNILPDRVQKMIKRKDRIIILLSIILSAVTLLGLYVFFFSDKYLLKPEPNDDLTAFGNVGKYRGLLNTYRKANLVYYDSADLRNYLDNIYPVLKKKQEDYMRERKFYHTGYVWQIGFYWTLKKDSLDMDARPRLKQDFYFIPVLADTSHRHKKNSVYDYFVKKDDSIYWHPPERSQERPFTKDSFLNRKTDPNLGNAYNEGTLWP